MNRRTYNVETRAFLLLTILAVVLANSNALPLFPSPPQEEKVPTDSAFNFLPSIALDPNPLQPWIWLVWQANSPDPGIPSRIMAKRFNFLTWTVDEPVSQGTGEETAPDIARLANGTMMVVWSGGTAQDRDLYYRLAPGPGIWFPSAPVKITSGTANDTSPALVQDQRGWIWLVWERQIGINTDVYYKYYDGAGWSSEFQLTSDPSGKLVNDRWPSIAQTKDGRVWVVWSSNQTSLQLDIFYTTFNGSGWSGPVRVVPDSESRPDQEPDILQDRNGTIRVFWSRPTSSTQGTLQGDIYTTNSTDNGRTWSPPERLTLSDAEDRGPAVDQFSDKRIWLFWTRALPGSIDLLYRKSDPIFTHDLAVTSIAGPEKARWNSTLNVNVTIVNLGDFQETPKVTLFLRDKVVESKTTIINVGSKEVVTFALNSLSYSPGRYTLQANATLFGEPLGNLGDNHLLGGSILLSAPGDLDLDGWVSINDIATMALAFDSTPGHPRWDPLADLNGNGKVEILDISLAAFWFDTKL